MKFWQNLFTLYSRPAVQTIVKEVLGLRLRSPGDARWWSFYECVDYLLPVFNRFPELFEKMKESNRCPETVAAFSDFLRFCGKVSQRATMPKQAHE